MNGYERRTERKKNKIQTAALELFCMYGIDKTSISEIAKKAGVSPASIYNYFGNKENLIKETIINVLENGWEVRKKLWESDLPFPEAIKRAITMKDEFIDQFNLETLKVLLEIDPEVKKITDDFNKNRYPYIISKFIEKGRNEGYIKRDISVEAATIYLRMYQDIIQQTEMIKNSNKDLLKELYDLMLYGLAGCPIDDKPE